METVNGVHLQIKNSHKFKSNTIKIRFTSSLSRYSVAARAIVASIFETANQTYPQLRMLQQRLASLYGTELSTSVHTLGNLHLVDIDIVFVKDRYLSKKEFLLDNILDLIHSVLFLPLAEGDAFLEQVFTVEQKNLIQLLQKELENDFIHASVESVKAFYDENPNWSLSSCGTIDLLESETARSTFKEYQRMLREDRIDFIFLGEFPENRIKERIQSWDFSPRDSQIVYQHYEPVATMVREHFGVAMDQQSVMDLAYYHPIFPDESSYPALLLFNALFGQFSNSFLFRVIREEKGMAYTVGSQLHAFSHIFRIYIGFEREQRNVIFKLIGQEMNRLRRGLISEEQLQASKKILRNHLLQAEDAPSYLIERLYRQAFFDLKEELSESWLPLLDSVTKKDIQVVARNIRLKSITVLEGSE